MYDAFYGLSALPFLLTPDPRFFFGSDGHRRAMSHLVYGLAQQEGFIVITGEIGAGKTTLIEQTCAQLDRRTHVIARIVTTQVSADDLLRLVMAGFGHEAPGADKATLLCRFEQMARVHRQQGRRCLLVVDEAQNLPPAALEELRILSNLAVEGRASVQTILLGQPQLRAMLSDAGWEQLRQRVLASFHLGPLSEAETRGYIEHRLHMVGWCNDPAWEDEALRSVHRQTGGIPRRINTLASRVLLQGALDEVHCITAAMVDGTAEELARDLGAGAMDTDASAHGGIAAGDLVRRLDLLERQVLRQEQAARRMVDLRDVPATGDT